MAENNMPEMPIPYSAASALGLDDLHTADQMRDYASKCVSAARAQALQEAYDAMFALKGDKVTRFDAQTAIRKLMEKVQ